MITYSPIKPINLFFFRDHWLFFTETEINSYVPDLSQNEIINKTDQDAEDLSKRQRSLKNAKNLFALFIS